MYTNTNFPNTLLASVSLAPNESVWLPVIDTAFTIRIALQLESVPDSAYNPPPQPTQNFTVKLYNVALNDTADTAPMVVKTASGSGNPVRATVFFDTIALSKVKILVTNNNPFGVYLTVRMSEAKMQ